MQLNQTTFKGIPIYELHGIEFLIHYAFKKKQSLFPINEKILRDFHLHEELLFNDTVTFPQDQAAQLCLKSVGLENAVLIDSYALWMQIIHTYKTDSRFYVIGDNEEVLVTCFKLLKQQYPEIKLQSFVIGDHLSKDFKAISKDLTNDQPDFVFVGRSKKFSRLFEMVLLSFRTQHNAIYVQVDDAFEQLVYKSNQYSFPKKTVFSSTK
jgi:hypothetical protein